MDDLQNLSLGYLDGLRKDMSSADFMNEYINPRLEGSPVVEAYSRAPYICSMVFSSGYIKPTVVSLVVLDTKSNEIVHNDEKHLSMYLLNMKAELEQLEQELKSMFHGLEIIKELK
jgi:hypothetical protein